MSTSPQGDFVALPTITSITCLEFLDQIFENISTQIVTIEAELKSSASSSSAVEQLKELHAMVLEIKENSATATALSSKMKEDRNLITSVNNKLGASAEVVKGVGKLIAVIIDLETEIINGEFDYFRILSEMYSNVLVQMTQFECYGALPHIKKIQARVSAIDLELKRKVQWSVREIGQLVHGDAEVNPNFPGPEINLDEGTIGHVYLVVDVLGLSFRKDLSNRMAQLQLIPYEKAFKFGTKYCGITHLEKRFVWFRMLLKVYDKKLGHIFPSKWCLPHYFFIEFSRRTKKHIKDYLAYQEKDESGASHQRVQDMLLSLKSLIQFQAEMKASFTVAIKGEDIDPSILEVKEPMAEVFDPYLGPYIQEERKELDNLMEKLGSEELKLMNSLDVSSINLSVTQPIFESSRKMFEYIKASLKRCNSFSSGVTYLTLSREFRVCLHNYALSLKFRHPSPVSAKAGERPVYNLSKYMEVQLCRLIKTGEYCIDTIPQLEKTMQEHIDDEFKDQISFSDEVDAFDEMISDTITFINIGIMEKIHPLLGKEGMRSIDWSKDQNVGDESKYMKSIFLILNDTIPRIRLNLSTAYFQQFCMKLSATLIEILLENIRKLKHISQTGSGQLLLDLNGLENYLNIMPQRYLPASDHDKYPISKVYTNSVSTNISKIKIILKLVCIEDDQFEEMFKVLWPEGSKKDHDDIMELRSRAGFLPHAVKDGVKAVGDKVGQATQATLSGVKNQTQKVEKGVTNSLGDFKAVFSMSLFDDDKPKPKPVTNSNAPKTPVTSSSSSSSSSSNSTNTQTRNPNSAPAITSSTSSSTSSTSTSSTSTSVVAASIAQKPSSTNANSNTNKPPPSTAGSGSGPGSSISNTTTTKAAAQAYAPPSSPSSSSSSSSSPTSTSVGAKSPAPNANTNPKAPSSSTSSGSNNSTSSSTNNNSNNSSNNSNSSSNNSGGSVLKNALGTLGLDFGGGGGSGTNKK